MNLEVRNITVCFDKAYVDCDGIVLGAALNVNGLFVIETESHSCRYITLFENEAAYKKKLFSDVIKCGTKLFFVPYSAKRIAIYDIETGEIVYLNLDIDDQPDAYSGKKFGAGLLYDEYVYMFGEGYEYILKICINTYEVEKIEIPEEDIIWNCNSMIRNDNRVIVLSNKKDKYLEFDLTTNSVICQSQNDELSRLEADEGLEDINSIICCEINERREEYWKDVFDSYSKSGIMVIEEKPEWIGLRELAEYVAWRKTTT